MKILHVNHLLDPVSGGGTAERTFQLARFLTKRGEHCGILTLDIGDTSSYEKLMTSEKLFKLKCLSQRYYIPMVWPFQLREVIRGFDVVHLMGHWTLLNAVVAIMCVCLKKPYVVCPAGSLKTTGRSQKLKNLYDFLIGRWIIKKANAWVAITEDEKQDFLAYAVAPELARVIPNGIDPGQYEPTEVGDLICDTNTKIGAEPYILFLGRLNFIKGPDLLLAAFLQVADQFPSIHLVFAGPDAGMLDELRDMVISSLMATRIHFIGYIGGKDKVGLLQKAFCLVIPSRNEAMSVVVLEAGICNTPVLFTNRCGLEAISEANAGYMVNPTSDDIASGLNLILSNPEDFQMGGQRLNEIVRRFYLWEAQASRYQQLYSEIIEGI